MNRRWRDFHITRLGSLCCNSVLVPHTAWNCTWVPAIPAKVMCHFNYSHQSVIDTQSVLDTLLWLVSWQKYGTIQVVFCIIYFYSIYRTYSRCKRAQNVHAKTKGRLFFGGGKILIWYFGPNQDFTPSKEQPPFCFCMDILSSLAP
jgi:hypothetical protein